MTLEDPTGPMNISVSTSPKSFKIHAPEDPPGFVEIAEEMRSHTLVIRTKGRKARLATWLLKLAARLLRIRGVRVVGVNMKPPEPEEIQSHRDRLRKFLRAETSLGMYGTAEDLEATRDAMRFFAHAREMTP